jgi:hypothetical protein
MKRLSRRSSQLPVAHYCKFDRTRSLAEALGEDMILAVSDGEPSETSLIKNLRKGHERVLEHVERS